MFGSWQSWLSGGRDKHSGGIWHNRVSFSFLPFSLFSLQYFLFRKSLWGHDYSVKLRQIRFKFLFMMMTTKMMFLSILYADKKRSLEVCRVSLHKNLPPLFAWLLLPPFHEATEEETEEEIATETYKSRGSHNNVWWIIHSNDNIASLFLWYILGRLVLLLRC